VLEGESVCCHECTCDFSETYAKSTVGVREDKGVVVVEGWGRRGHNAPSKGVGKVSPLLVGFSRLVVEISNEDTY